MWRPAGGASCDGRLPLCDGLREGVKGQRNRKHGHTYERVVSSTAHGDSLIRYAASAVPKNRYNTETTKCALCDRLTAKLQEEHRGYS